jgi:hypothetical protein
MKEESQRHSYLMSQYYKNYFLQGYLNKKTLLRSKHKKCIFKRIVQPKINRAMKENL